MFPGGKGQGCWEEVGSTVGNKGYMKLSPAGQDAAWSVCMEAAMLGVEIRNCGWWRQGRRSLGRSLGKVRVSAQNLATHLGRKGVNS